jgi:outer membrane lipoprotein-sorting protein
MKLTARDPAGECPLDPRYVALTVCWKQLCVFSTLVVLTLCALQVSAAETMTAASVMQRGEERFRGLTDYECLVDLDARVGKKVQTGTCQFWFKQPRMLRVKVLRGSRKGSQVAVDSTGQIRGSKGGILGLIVRRMKSTDARLLTIRGTSMLTLDWGSFFLKYRAAVLRPDARVVLAPRADARTPYQVTVTYPNLGKAVREVYSVDPERWLIVEGAVYEDETRVEHVLFREIKLDTGVKEQWFRL